MFIFRETNIHQVSADARTRYSVQPHMCYIGETWSYVWGSMCPVVCASWLLPMDLSGGTNWRGTAGVLSSSCHPSRLQAASWCHKGIWDQGLTVHNACCGICQYMPNRLPDRLWISIYPSSWQCGTLFYTLYFYGYALTGHDSKLKIFAPTVLMIRHLGLKEINYGYYMSRYGCQFQTSSHYKVQFWKDRFHLLLLSPVGWLTIWNIKPRCLKMKHIITNVGRGCRTSIHIKLKWTLVDTQPYSGRDMRTVGL